MDRHRKKPVILDPWLPPPPEDEEGQGGREPPGILQHPAYQSDSWC